VRRRDCYPVPKNPSHERERYRSTFLFLSPGSGRLYALDTFNLVWQSDVRYQLLLFELTFVTVQLCNLCKFVFSNIVLYRVSSGHGNSLEFSRTIFQAWKVIENNIAGLGHGQSKHLPAASPECAL